MGPFMSSACTTSPATFGLRSAANLASAAEHVGADQPTNEYCLSKRGLYNSLFRDVWGPRESLQLGLWSATNPDGRILLKLAENSLLHKDITAFIEKQLKILPTEHLTYSTGPRGSFRLRNALSRYFEKEFQSIFPVTSDDLFVTPGLTSAIDSLVFAICDPGDGILIPEPYYNGFKYDITHRSEAQIVGVTYDDLESYSSYDDVFQPEMTKAALAAALDRAHSQGIRLRAILISNPHNPLGRCYPAETIIEFIRFAKDNNLHFISDEIYAKSVFENPAIPAERSSFVSALSLDWKTMIAQNQFHVLYSASKDFCANGLRVGVVYSKNKGIHQSMSSIGAFSWTPHLVQDIWAAMIEDGPWLKEMHEKNKILMAESYAIISAFLKTHEIPFYEMNAGLYVWVDCRRFLFPVSVRGEADFSLLRVGGPHDKEYGRREARLSEICIEHKVMISPGTIYEAREYGWFRITFTAERSMLEEGLHRLWKAFNDPEIRDWINLESQD